MSTPWPIELGEHPGFRKERKKAIDVTATNSSMPESEITTEQAEQIARECFENPVELRELVLEHVHIPSKEKFDGGNVFYMWLNKTCPVGCEFCFFKSPEKEAKSDKTEITQEGIDKIVRFSEDARLDKFFISGGGEPMKSKDKVYDMARRVNANIFTVVTSGFWAKKEFATNKYLSELFVNAQKNPHHPITVLRLSLDSEHLAKLSRGEGFNYIQHIIDWFSQNAPNNPRFKFLIHTMEGDKTVDDLLAQLPVETREDKGTHLKRSTDVKLQNGFAFSIEYSQIFDSNPQVDLQDTQQAEKNNQTFRDFINFRRNGNMSLQFHDDGKKGVYFLLLYDGTTIVWGATAPDVETSIYSDNFKGMMQKNLDDVITMASLEKGPCYIQDIVNEVNPTAVSRAVGVSLRDFYARLLWEEDTTRLYASIRIIQEYLEEGRISANDMREWPVQLRALVLLDQDTLKTICLESPHTIVHQYLADPKLNPQKLIALYKLVSLHHYNMTPDKMKEIVNGTDIDPEIKRIFNEATANEFCLRTASVSDSLDN